MDRKVINNLRSLSLDMINDAQSGHPGICLGAAPIMYTLFANHLNFNKVDGNWLNRDRFILSAGHGSALLYSTLLLSGYPIEISDLKKYRQINSKLQGHPELSRELGIEMTTGPLGEGFATSIGFAIAEEYLRSILGSTIVNHFTYVLVSDGDLMEGISYEAMSLAGSLGLGKLIVLYDSNSTCLDGNINKTFKENVLKRFEASGWHTEQVVDGENILLINKAIENAKSILNKPSIIEIKTIIGKGSIFEGSNKTHGKPLDEKDYLLLKKKLGYENTFYHISKDSTIYFREKQEKRIEPIYNEWVKNYNEIYQSNENVKKILNYLENNTYELNLKKVKIHLEEGESEELRVSNGKLMNLLSDLLPLTMSVSSDLFTSTKTYFENGGDFSEANRKGKNIYAGVRENLMGAIINGLALNNIRAFGSTFLTFSDYMKPSQRLAALMNLSSTFIFTHDSIMIGEDGSTHQPIEQLSMLRSIPNMITFRPADIKEVVGSWDFIINNKKPVNIVLAKDKIKNLVGTKIEGVEKGAYIVKEPFRISAIILASGSEVSTAIDISDELLNKGYGIRVISVPSLELFDMQDEEYKKELIPLGSKVIVIEASNDKSWYEYIYNKKYLLNIKDFGTSGKKVDVLKHFEFDFDSLIKKIEQLIK